jgi:hypothetical protein
MGICGSENVSRRALHLTKECFASNTTYLDSTSSLWETALIEGTCDPDGLGITVLRFVVGRFFIGFGQGNVFGKEFTLHVRGGAFWRR